jgi:hypothetical protein
MDPVSTALRINDCADTISDGWIGDDKISDDKISDALRLCASKTRH